MPTTTSAAAATCGDPQDLCRRNKRMRGTAGREKLDPDLRARRAGDRSSDAIRERGSDYERGNKECRQ